MKSEWAERSKMAIITISRGTYSRGQEVAERVAETLGYDCVSREVLLEASEEYNIPEIKLVRAIHDAPSFFERQTYGKERYIAFIRAVLLARVQHDNVVYHGLAGHCLLHGVGHVMKIRIVADMNDRVRWEMEREGNSYDEACKLIAKDDEQRYRWGMNMYGVDTRDSSLYDLCFNVSRVPVDQVVEVICAFSKLEPFCTSDDSQQALDDRVLGAKVKAALVHVRADLEVTADQGSVKVLAPVGAFESEATAVETIERTARTIEGIDSVEVVFLPTILY